MKRPRRKAIPKSVCVAVEERQNGVCACGCWKQVGKYFWSKGPKPTRWDHRPPLALRPLNEDGTDYDPPQLDPRYIDALTPECHDKRTFQGRSGATSVGSDAHAIAKTRRILKGGRKRKGRKMRSAGFDKRLKRRMDGTVVTRTHRRIGE